MEVYNNVQTFHAKSRKEWRKWLEKNHSTEKSIWLVIHKKESEIPPLAQVFQLSKLEGRTRSEIKVQLRAKF